MSKIEGIIVTTQALEKTYEVGASKDFGFKRHKFGDS
jgi:hypothetical protein